MNGDGSMESHRLDDREAQCRASCGKGGKHSRLVHLSLLEARELLTGRAHDCV